MRRNVHLVAWSLVLVTAVLAGCHSAWVSSGIIYRDQQQDYAKAEEMFKRAIDRSGGTEAIAWYELGNTLVYRVENDHMANDEADSALMKMELAHEAYIKAAELDPEEYGDNPDAETEAERHVVETAIRAAYARMYNNGAQKMTAGLTDDAILWFELAYLADPRGEAGFDARLIRSQLRYNQQIEDDSQDADPEVLRDILAELESLEVEPDWEEAAKDKTDLVRAKVGVLRSLGREDEATDLYVELLESDPDNLDLLQQVARARETNGESKAAGELYERAFRVATASEDSDDRERFNLGILAINAYSKGEDYESLIALYPSVEPFAQGSKQNADLAITKARAHYELEEFQEAVDVIEPVVVDGGFNPNSLIAWQIYYRSLNSVGRVEDSQRARERFIALRDGA